MMLLHILDADTNYQESGSSKSGLLHRKASQGWKVMGKAGGGSDLTDKAQSHGTQASRREQVP